ncbi:MAG: DNA-binding domain-containing protein [Pseudomonadota bacterium]
MPVSQRDFRESLLDPTRAVPEGLQDPAGRPAGKRFDVYRNNVVASLSEALGTGFPVIRKLLGEERFRMLAISYTRAHPPRSPLMMHMGADLPAFLAGFEQLASYGYLPDVARLELAMRQSYHAADAAPLDPALFGQLPPEDLAESRLTLAPSLHLVESAWPIVQIWQFNMAGGPKPVPRAETALVTRPGFDPQIKSVGQADGAFLRAIMDRIPIGAAAERAANQSPDFDLVGLLGTLLADRAITQLSPPTDQGHTP